MLAASALLAVGSLSHAARRSGRPFRSLWLPAGYSWWTVDRECARRGVVKRVIGMSGRIQHGFAPWACSIRHALSAGHGRVRARVSGQALAGARARERARGAASGCGTGGRRRTYARVRARAHERARGRASGAARERRAVCGWEPARAGEPARAHARAGRRKQIACCFESRLVWSLSL